MNERVNPAWLIAAAILMGSFLLVAIARGDDDVNRYSCNPLGTQGVIYGRTIMNPPADEACMNLRVHAIAPATRQVGDVWIEHNPPLSRLCFTRALGEDVCINGTEAP